MITSPVSRRDDSTGSRPVSRNVTRDDEDTSAVIVVTMALLKSADSAAGPRDASVFADLARTLRVRGAPSPDAWWASGLPGAG